MNGEILSLNALDYLKSGYILYLIIDNTKFKFKYFKNKIYIVSNNISQIINEYMFKSLYKDSKFYLDDENIEEIDIKKDEEYYSWPK